MAKFSGHLKEGRCQPLPDHRGLSGGKGTENLAHKHGVVRSDDGQDREPHRKTGSPPRAPPTLHPLCLLTPGWPQAHRCARPHPRKWGQLELLLAFPTQGGNSDWHNSATLLPPQCVGGGRQMNQNPNSTRLQHGGGGEAAQSARWFQKVVGKPLGQGTVGSLASTTAGLDPVD